MFSANAVTMLAECQKSLFSSITHCVATSDRHNIQVIFSLVHSVLNELNVIYLSDRHDSLIFCTVPTSHMPAHPMLFTAFSKPEVFTNLYLICNCSESAVTSTSRGNK